MKAIINHPLYREYLEKNAQREKERRFCRHDFQHMEDVARVSYNILTDSGRIGDIISRGVSREFVREVIYAAGLLHDIARWIQYDTGEDHALAGARLARPIMENTGFDPRETALALRAIREHRRGGPGASLLGRTLCLADDLSRPCGKCDARLDCYKFEQMENIRRELALTQKILVL
ncbi:HD domain-containing protein [Desulfocucumis palustris]|uniref:HD domain-containing protein n=1 Tax=Desulfocucumis palustris TaxID=1898651 RepID=UPI001E513D5E|nr:HD domain-containing protein [Desulfocucumis palustris]